MKTIILKITKQSWNVCWCAQLLEHVKNPHARITRPRQVYLGK